MIIQFIQLLKKYNCDFKKDLIRQGIKDAFFFYKKRFSGSFQRIKFYDCIKHLMSNCKILDPNVKSERETYNVMLVKDTKLGLPEGSNAILLQC